MNELYETLIDVLLAIVIMFISVAIYFGIRTETVFNASASNISNEVVLEAKKNGYISVNDYENFIEKMSLTGTLYDIEFEHDYHLHEPEYRFQSLEEIIAAQNEKYTGSNIYHYKEVVTQKPIVSDPINNDGLTMNTETNESILASASGTPSTNHVHTSSCYVGHKHTDLSECYFIHNHAHSGCTRFKSTQYIFQTCANCGNRFNAVAAYWYWNTTYNQVVLSGMYPTNSCPMCGSTSTVPSEYEVLDYYSYSCGYDIDTNGDGFNEDTGYAMYQYKKSTPQDTSKKATYTTGCYSYHVARDYESLLRYYPYSGQISNKEEVYNILANANFQGFCSIPKYFTIKYHVESSTVNRSVSYHAQVSQSGEITFNYGGYYEYYLTGGWGSSENPGFPQTITVSQLKSLSSTGSFNDFFYSGTGYYTYSNGSHYVEVDYSGTVDMCEYDHSLANQWALTCGQVENATLVCSQKVISIVPTNPVQAVYTGEALITVAKVTYQDGSTSYVVCTTNFSTNAPINSATATLSYTDAFGNILTRPITVTVIPKTKTCVHGHIYNLNIDGSDPGCIYCNNWVSNIQIINPTTTTMTITIGTTMQDNGIKILVTYMNGHTETITTGYIDNLDKSYLGTKQVTFGYKGVTTQLLVTTICAKMTCDICGYVYNLYPDGTNPGCPRCISKTPIFTGNVLEEDKAVYTNEILDELYTDGKYSFNNGDTLTIKIYNRTTNLGRNILRRVFPSLSDRWYMYKKSEIIGEK